MLRRKGVVGKFVEFYGDGLANLPLADRATIANMAPEYGATCGIFPIDAETLRYLELSGRPANADRAGRGVLQGPGAVPHAGTPRGRVLRHARARPRRRSSRAWPARSGRRTACRCARPRTSFAQGAQGDARGPAEPPPSRPRPPARRRPTSRASIRLEGEGGGGTAVGVEDPHAPVGRLSAAPRRATSSTARSSSPRSRAAPTRRTPR